VTDQEQIAALKADNELLKACNESQAEAMSRYWNILAPEYEGELSFPEVLQQTVHRLYELQGEIDNAYAQLGIPDGRNLAAEVKALVHHRNCAVENSNGWRERAHNLQDNLQQLREAGKAVIHQWDTPHWKLTEHTAVLINALRRALDETPKQTSERMQKRASAERDWRISVAVSAAMSSLFLTNDWQGKELAVITAAVAKAQAEMEAAAQRCKEAGNADF
jgi:hypothetical protein